ncbi:MAG TPA: response regulator [Gemmatimonadales bacterium]
MKRILVVDDDADLRSALTRVLTHAGYQVRSAADGAEALRLHQEVPADLVLTDVYMPGEDGLAEIRELRAGWPGVRIAAMSGAADRGDVDLLEVARAFGADAAIAKPFELDAMLALVRSLLGGA